MIISDEFKRMKAPETGREVVQLTSGEGFCYPLYYFIPSISKDEKYLIFHRAVNGEIQLHRLNLENAEVVQLTYGTCKVTHWLPWCSDDGGGILDHRSVLNVVRNQVIYFNGNDVHTVDIETLEDEKIFSIEDDRIAISQNCVTPDGKWFIYIHHDRETYDEMFDGKNDYEKREKYWKSRHLSEGTTLCAYNFDTKEHRTLVIINSPIHHVLPYDNEHLIFCHPCKENGMMLTDLNGGWYTHLRTQDVDGGQVCHYLATKKGIMYEVLGGENGVLGGVYNPFNHKKVEFLLPSEFGYTHTGCDPDGKLLFYENFSHTNHMKTHTDSTIHDMYMMVEYNQNGDHEWKKLIGNWPTFGGGQKSHFHPRLTPDRQWIIFTVGDDKTKSNQIYLLNISDIHETKGIPDVYND